MNVYSERSEIVFAKPNNITEYEYLAKVWVEVFELLFGSTIINVKWGESVCDLTTKGKLSNNCNTTKTIDLKLDARFLANINMDGEFIDISNMEAAKYQDRSKLYLDKAKLSVETKCLLDNLVLHCDPSVIQNLKLMNVRIEVHEGMTGMQS